MPIWQRFKRLMIKCQILTVNGITNIQRSRQCTRLRLYFVIGAFFMIVMHIVSECLFLYYTETANGISNANALFLAPFKVKYRPQEVDLDYYEPCGKDCFLNIASFLYLTREFPLILCVWFLGNCSTRRLLASASQANWIPEDITNEHQNWSLDFPG